MSAAASKASNGRPLAVVMVGGLMTSPPREPMLASAICEIVGHRFVW